ncbi:MAG: bifunctional UDP-N-acetylglucosamine diphosphorylase/glucosamine-1-phosphate N-acetyltransferase GlmU, partial [Gammaproteobacteria bacterium]|nr:bifunctional UDP-N-acetylglucosamine diphosphorylase/glucosamine-1-phosphate N-acetyltransferase GlmU [Gammaproteobacteria bacterium]
MNVSVVILAAGQGTRMRSDLPKVLQPLAGKPLLEHVLDAAQDLNAAKTMVVYGHGGDRVQAYFESRNIDWVLQAEQLGTGHAVKQALPHLDPDDIVLILCGDVPLVRAETVESLVSATAGGKLAVLTTVLPDPTGYGRIIRDVSGHVVEIVEEKDANADQRRIAEINTGLMACPGRRLATWLERLTPNNVQGEYYLTDIVACAIDDGVAVVPVDAPDYAEVLGINDKRQLAEAEAMYRRRVVGELLHNGVTIVDPERVDVRGRVTCGRDVFIDVNVVLAGDVELGDGVTVGPNTIIRDAVIGAGTEIRSHCLIEETRAGKNCQIGPYARTRPGVEMADEARLGNFVEIKKSRIGKGSKVNHLTYIGDATIGDAVNVGAGTITCNYDGANKHQTTIGDGAFIGSGVELVAPVE